MESKNDVKDLQTGGMTLFSHNQNRSPPPVAGIHVNPTETKSSPPPPYSRIGMRTSPSWKPSEGVIVEQPAVETLTERPRYRSEDSDVLELTWVFNVFLDCTPRCCSYTEHCVEVTGALGILILRGASITQTIRFYNMLLGIPSFEIGSYGYGKWRKVTVVVPHRLGLFGASLGEIFTTSSNGHKITDEITGKTFISSNSHGMLNGGIVIIRDASSDEEYANVSKIDSQNFTLTVTNFNATPWQKALFLGFVFLCMKRQGEGHSGSG